MSQPVSTPLISVVIVTWNGKRYALECLASLRALNHESIQVIVVDNASTDGTPQEIRESYPEVELIQNRANLGFARANNIGIDRARGEFVCLVNSDVVVPAGCFENMVHFMQENPSVGLLGPRMLSPAGGVGASVMKLPGVWNTLSCALGLHSIFRRSDFFGGYLMPGFPYDRTEDVEVLTGWFWMVPRKALELVGGLDERFFMYGEDIDWSHRFLKAGWRVVFFPGAEALHYGAASSAQSPGRFYVEMRRANLQYFRKHHGHLLSLAYLAAVWVHELVRVCAYAAVYCLNRLRRPEADEKMRRSIDCMKWLASAGTAGVS